MIGPCCCWKPEPKLRMSRALASGRQLARAGLGYVPTRSLAQLLILILRHRGREQQRRDERHERQEDSRARHSA